MPLGCPNEKRKVQVTLFKVTYATETICIEGGIILHGEL